MFTGIVQSQAEVISITTENQLSRLVIGVSPELVSKLEIGASIAINGVCLTVVEYNKQADNSYTIAFDIIDETLRVTTLGNLSVHDWVNVERSLKVGDEIGGHIVSGHVQYKSILMRKDVTETNTALYFKCESPWLKYIFEKGFITVNGTSLTIGVIKDNTFSVHLIPETLTRTNLGKLNVNDEVNLEFDQQTITIVKTIERLNLSELTQAK
ncbi:riboflavin synthase subunit alpha [Colwellia sp. UCD-KL20]|uniref:riboflavin synthase subunit alpha n=1 Tax=Colwellia sp. UCD-KL20 TaxID=1917165 RepID=UPI000970693A|nr:riboflavin synthase subunit alpha [Colwellia sp. UCD-KL20]